MRIEPFTHKNVAHDGTMPDVIGAVETTANARWSTNTQHGERCEFLILNAGRNADGWVYGLTIYFDNKAEMERFCRREDMKGYV